MITIRYSDLPEGLHARAEALGNRTVIYLRPGLTPEQRRRGLRRAMQSARMGYGPRLPATGVALAVARDACVSTLRNAAAAVRTHPAGSMMLAAGMVASLACYAVVVTASLRFITPPGHHPAGLPVATAPHGQGDGRRDSGLHHRGRDGGAHPHRSGAGAASPHHSSHPGPSRTPRPSPSGTPKPTGPPHPTPTPEPSTTRPTPPASTEPAPPSPTPTAGCPLPLCL